MEKNLIVEWVLGASGKYEIDLAESGIQYHYLRDFKIGRGCNLNYSSDAGSPELREKISKLYRVKKENVLITNGSQEAMYILLNVLLREGDEVVIISPGWQQYEEVAKKIGAKIKKLFLDPKEDFQLNPSDLKKLISKKTKAVIINSPHNPTGLKFDIKKIKTIIPKGVFLINDEVYLLNPNESVTYNCEDKNFISVGSLSKIQGVPGIRIGWMIGLKSIVDEAINYRRYTTISNSALGEDIALEIFKDYSKYLKEYHNLVSRGFHTLKKWVEEQKGIKLIKPHGTPFALIKYKFNIPSKDLCEQILNKEKVLLVPGSSFGTENCFRISFGRDPEILNKGLRKISRFFGNINENSDSK